MYYSLDIETTGLDYFQDKLLGLGVYSTNEKKYITDPTEIKQWFTEHSDGTYIGQNFKFDRNTLRHCLGVNAVCHFDTNLAASLVKNRPDRLNLGALVEYYLGVPSYKESDFIANLSERPVEDQAAYCLDDCRYTFQLAQILTKELVECGNWEFFQRYMMPGADLAADLEYNGIPIDVASLDNILAKALARYDELEEEMYRKYEHIIKEFEIAKIQEKKSKLKTPLTEEKIAQWRKHKDFKFNFNSNTQKQWLLKEKLGFPCVKTEYERGKKKEVISTSVKVIDEYLGQHDIIQELITLNDCETICKQATQYREFIKSDGRIHAKLNLSSTDTGRTSSSEPNMQNVVTEIDDQKLVDIGQLRSIVRAPSGKKLVIADLGQVEPRLMAHFSQDPVLLDTFRSGKDFYAIIANEVMRLNLSPEFLYKKAFKAAYPVQRVFGKETGLSLAYGTGPNTFKIRVSKATGVPHSWKDAKGYIDRYFEVFSGIPRFRQEIYQEVSKYGYVDTLFGCRIFISADEALHKGINWKIQCSASHYAFFSQLWVREYIKEYGFDAKFIMFIHDEVVYEVDEAQADNFAVLLKTILEHGMEKYRPDIKLTVPMEADVIVADSWVEKS